MSQAHGTALALMLGATAVTKPRSPRFGEVAPSWQGRGSARTEPRSASGLQLQQDEGPSRLDLLRAVELPYRVSSLLR